MRKLNLAFVVNSLDVGGLEKVVISLINKLDRDKFDISLICLDRAGKLIGDIDLPEDHILVLDKSAARKFGPLSFDPTMLWRIRQFLVRRRIDIVHAHNGAPLIYGAIASKLGVRHPLFIYSEHSQICSATETEKKKFMYYVRLVDHIFAVSKDLQRILTRLNVPRPIHVLYNGISADRFKELHADGLREQFGAKPDDFLVGTCVRITEQKGLIYLLKAIPRVAKVVPNIKFAIVGDGPLLDTLKQESHDLGIDQYVSFPGYRRDVPQVISSFNLYVLPSLWEGLPLALIEALAIGKPAVATSVGGNAELIEDGVNGFIVEPKDVDGLAEAIVRVAQDPTFVEQVREVNKRKFKEQFTEDVMVNNHAMLYEKLADPRKSLGPRRRLNTW